MTQYTWKSNIFSSKTAIARDHKNIGYFSINFFGVTRMELLHQEYRCKRTGFLGKTLELYATRASEPMAILIFHTWKRSVSITYKQTAYQMKYDSLLGSRFKMYHDDNIIYTYHPSFASGTMETDTDDPLLITLGIYAHIRRRNNT
ncbi:hypothetical protein ACFO3O_19735 [Dokdonia ponticola]|uniref:Uncharacterized protein n=1 Tax=Dokdonia ponticola TaxID=2041041 RepID=A0ABV9I210_9FLAO